MNTNREIISEVEQMAVNAIVNQPDERKAAEKHFSETAKKIVETAIQAIDIMEVGDVCRRAVTGASIQDYDLLAKLLTDKDFDHDRLAKSIEALASERPIDYPPTYYTPGWLADLAKKMAAEKPTDAELHEAATEEPSAPVSAAPRGVTTLPPGADGTPSADEDEQRKAQSEQQREEARQKRKIHWKTYETKVDLCVMGKTQQNGKVYEVRINKRQTDVSDTYAQCKVNGNVVLTCSFIGGAWMLKRILTGGMQSLVEYKAKRNRDRRRRCAKLATAAKAAQAGEVA